VSHERSSWLVETDVTVPPEPQHDQVEAARPIDRPFEAFAFRVDVGR